MLEARIMLIVLGILNARETKRQVESVVVSLVSEDDRSKG